MIGLGSDKNNVIYMKGAPTYGIYIQYIFSIYFVAIYCHFYERGLPQIGCHSSEMFLSHESWQIWHKHRKLGSSWGLKLLSLECFNSSFLLNMVVPFGWKLKLASQQSGKFYSTSVCGIIQYGVCWCEGRSAKSDGVAEDNGEERSSNSQLCH